MQEYTARICVHGEFTHIVKAKRIETNENENLVRLNLKDATKWKKFMPIKREALTKLKENKGDVELKNARLIRCDYINGAYHLTFLVRGEFYKDFKAKDYKDALKQAQKITCKNTGNIVSKENELLFVYKGMEIIWFLDYNLNWKTYENIV